MAPDLKSDDYYEILGCSRGASDDQLKKAYRKLAVKWHPDKNPGDEEATKNFQKISEAYATLSDKKKRQIYDQYGAEAANQADQMPGGAAGGSPFGPGAHFGHGGGGGGPHMHMSQAEADRIFASFFGGGDPFGASFGGGHSSPHISFNSSMGGGGMPGIFGGPMGGGGGGSIRSNMGGGGFGGMPGGMGGMPGGSFRQRPAEKRFDAIPSGTVVSLKGLVSKPERNGDRGEVQGYDPSKDRYSVLVEDSDEILNVRPGNLLQHVHVTLQNLQGTPELNGSKGSIIAWNEQQQRYSIYVMSVAKSFSLRPTNVILEKGTVGKIVGLVAKPELNGKYGTIQAWHKDSNRYDVQLSPSQILRLKVENIHV